MDSDQSKECTDNLRRQPELAALCFLIFGLSVVVFLTSMLSRSPVINCLVGVMVAAIMIAGIAIMFSPTAARIICFSLTLLTIHYTYDSASLYFFTDSQREYANGPQFSAVALSSLIGPVGGIFSIIGFISFAYASSGW